MDRGTWWATVNGVAKSQTWLSTHTQNQQKFIQCLFYMKMTSNDQEQSGLCTQFLMVQCGSFYVIKDNTERSNNRMWLSVRAHIYIHTINPGTAKWERFPGGSDSKESASNSGYQGSIPRLGRSPGEGSGQPTPVFLPGKSHGWRSLAGFQESEMTEQLHFLSLWEKWGTFKPSLDAPLYQHLQVFTRLEALPFCCLRNF